MARPFVRADRPKQEIGDTVAIDTGTDETRFSYRKLGRFRRAPAIQPLQRPITNLL